MVFSISFRSLCALVSVPALLASFAGDCFAPVAAPEPSLKQRSVLAQDRLDQRLALWQHRLQLDNWKVTLVQSGRKELRRGTLGNIHWDAETKKARIRVLGAAEYPAPFETALRDMEFTLVHELLHLQLSGLPHSDESRSEEELAVNRMADALLLLDRQKQAPVTAILQAD